MTVKVCDTNGRECCTTPLKNYKAVGALDIHNTEDVLGDCFNFKVKGDVKVTLTIDGTNGWWAEYVRVVFGDGRRNVCPVKDWLDVDGTSVPTRTVECIESKLNLRTPSFLLSI